MEHTIEREDLHKKIDEFRNILELEKKFSHGVFESAPIAIMLVSRDGKIEMSNRKAEQIIGKSSENLRGMSLQEVIPDADILRSDTNEVREFEKNVSWNGCALSWKSTIIRDEEGDIVGATVFGSVLETVSANTVWCERIDAIRTFASFLANNFSTLLGSAAGYSARLHDMTSPDDKIFNYVCAMESSMQRILSMNEKMLLFGNGGEPDKLPFDINDHLVELCADWQPSHENIVLQTNLAINTRCVNADWLLIKEALLALLDNAEKSMPDGGRILITTEQVDVTGPSPNIMNYPGPGTYIRTTIEDFGEGMDDKTLAKAFLPFFSTRDKRNSSGMGIPIAFGIINRHNGYLTLQSEVGHGTCASLYLPLQDFHTIIHIADGSVLSEDQFLKVDIS